MDAFRKNGAGAMPVIPVVDLLRGFAAHAVRGQRDGYRPVRGVLGRGDDPLALALALQAETAAPAVYLADLDAIVAGRGDRELVGALARELPCELWVDAGVADAAGALGVLETGAARVVAGTESLESLDALDAMAKAVGWDRLLVSLDVMDGATLSKAPALRGRPPLESLDLLACLGAGRFILLTLSGVGAGMGPDWPLLEPARKRLPKATLIAGGGTRDMKDVRRCEAMGLDGVLVGTALHNGRITAAALRGEEA